MGFRIGRQHLKCLICCSSLIKARYFTISNRLIAATWHGGNNFEPKFQPNESIQVRNPMDREMHNTGTD